MCGRFANHLEWTERWAQVLGRWPAGLEGGYNIAPSATIAAFTTEGGLPMRWGLVPAWSAQAESRYSTFNARIEGIETKPAFRSAWHGARRCLIPVLGWYEWQRGADGKQPWFLRPQGDQPALLAGLWESWRHGELLSCTVITREAVGVAARVHHRMPAVIGPEQIETWYRGGKDDARALVESGPGIDLRTYPVSRYVNNARNEGPRCVAAFAG